MTAVFKREFKSYFTTPIGFLIVAVFTIFSTLFFSIMYLIGSPTVETVVYRMSNIAVYITPFITMRLFSEDRRQKIDQALLTAPVKVTSIVMGKFFSALALFALGFSITLIYQLIITFNVSVNWLIYLYALLGALLLGCVLISIGMFISSLTESPIISAALTLGIFLAVSFIGSYASVMNITWLQKISEYIAFIDRFADFTTGVLNFADLVYMVSVSALFIFLSVRSIEKRRWA